MTRKLTIWIVACFVLSIGVVAMLFALSKDIRQQPGSFLREFPPFPALEAEALNLKYNSYYIAGGTSHHVYIANYSAPSHLIVANSDFTDTLHVKLNVRGISDQKTWAIQVKVDSPYYYVIDGTVPFIYKGNVHNWKADINLNSSTYFMDIVPLTEEIFFIRSLGGHQPENILGKLKAFSPYSEMKQGILQKQVDGVFCTDGMMHYDKMKNRLLYLHRYRNEYIVMDTSLNILQRQHTIDTITHAKIEVSAGGSSKDFFYSSEISSPKRTVNKRSCVWSGFLFVHSMLLARNEPYRAHDSSSVIDVYDFETGEYKFSFYIYDYSGKEKLRDFKVFDNRLYALFDEHIQIWNLSPKYFSK